jgi:hypothetical protein
MNGSPSSRKFLVFLMEHFPFQGCQSEQSSKIVVRIGEQYRPKCSCNRGSFGGASTEAKEKLVI